MMGDQRNQLHDLTPSGTTSDTRRKRGGTGLNDLFIAVFGVGFLVSLSLNVLHLTGRIDNSYNTPLHQAVLDFKKDLRSHNSENDGTLNDDIKFGQLDCDAYGGPPKELSQEMVYWHDIPEDAKWVSPFKHPTETKYLTFEPDGGTIRRHSLPIPICIA